MLTYSLLKMDVGKVDVGGVGGHNRKDEGWNVTSFRRELFLWEEQCSITLTTLSN